LTFQLLSSSPAPSSAATVMADKFIPILPLLLTPSQRFRDEHHHRHRHRHRQRHVPAGGGQNCLPPARVVLVLILVRLVASPDPGHLAGVASTRVRAPEADVRSSGSGRRREVLLPETEGAQEDPLPLCLGFLPPPRPPSSPPEGAHARAASEMSNFSPLRHCTYCIWHIL